MAIINSYRTVTPEEGDLVLISDVSEEGNPTRTATVSSLGLLSQGGGLVGPTGPQGSAGVEGPTGPQGATGNDGTSINILGTKPTVGDLPTTGNTLNDLWIIDQTGGGATAGDGYVWTAGNTWLNIGPLRGPQGLQGNPGIQGDPGLQGNPGVQGDPGVNPTGAILNTTDTFTTPKVEYIVSLASNEYPPAVVDPNTLYVII